MKDVFGGAGPKRMIQCRDGYMWCRYVNVNWLSLSGSAELLLTGSTQNGSFDWEIQENVIHDWKMDQTFVDFVRFSSNLFMGFSCKNKYSICFHFLPAKSRIFVQKIQKENGRKSNTLIL